MSRMRPQPALWTPVDGACGKHADAADGFPPHTPPFQEPIGFLGEVVDALMHAVETLAARVEGLEHQFGQYLAIVDEPLSPTEALERLRQLREQMV